MKILTKNKIGGGGSGRGVKNAKKIGRGVGMVRADVKEKLNFL